MGASNKQSARKISQPMRLIIHAGLHKTASTSFQKFCHDNRETLAAHGVHYPQLAKNAFNHNAIAHQFQSGHFERAEHDFANNLLQLPRPPEIVLLSGEDFEFALGNSDLASAIARMAHSCDFTSVEWCFVLRDRWSYLCSQYAELSKHGIVTDFQSMAQEIRKFRNFTCSNSNLRRYYEFDFENRFQGFARLVDHPVSLFEFDEFCESGVGAPLFEHLCGEDLLADLSEAWKLATKQGLENKRASWFTTEYRFSCHFLGLNPNTLRPLKAAALGPLIVLREYRKRRAQAELEGAFRAEFPLFNTHAIKPNAGQ